VQFIQSPDRTAYL